MGEKVRPNREDRQRGGWPTTTWVWGPKLWRRFPYPAPFLQDHVGIKFFDSLFLFDSFNSDATFWRTGMKGILLVVWFFPLLLLAGCAGPSRLSPPVLEPPTRGIYHEVQKGESLWRIGQSYHVSVDDIISVNKLPDPSRLSPGQLLFIPTSSVRLPASPSSASSASLKKIPPGTPHFSWPVKGRVLSSFGQRTPLGKNRGIDLLAKEGSPVLAAAPGRVSFAGEKVKGFGKTVILEHNQQFQTVYTHNQELLVKPGDVVQQQQVIAKVGETGRVQQPTLHFEIRRRNHPLNPMEHLSHE